MMVLCPKAGSLALSHRGWDERGGFPLASSQTIMGEQLVQGRYAVAWGRFEPATLRIQGAEHTPTPLRPTIPYTHTHVNTHVHTKFLKKHTFLKKTAKQLTQIVMEEGNRIALLAATKFAFACSTHRNAHSPCDKKMSQAAKPSPNPIKRKFSYADPAGNAAAFDILSLSAGNQKATRSHLSSSASDKDWKPVTLLAPLSLACQSSTRSTFVISGQS